MASFGKDLICKNLQCTTVNGNAPSGGSSKWIDVPGTTDDIERTNGNVIVKNQLQTDNLKYNRLDYQNFATQSDPLPGQGIRILQFGTNSFSSVWLIQLVGNELNTNIVKFKIQHADTAVNNLISDKYILRCSGLGIFTTIANPFSLIASNNQIAPNNLELQINSLNKNFVANSNILRFALELIPFNAV